MLKRRQQDPQDITQLFINDLDDALRSLVRWLSVQRSISAYAILTASRLRNPLIPKI
jgi:hypothetical protein